MNEYTVPDPESDVPGKRPEAAFLQDDKGYYKVITRKREIPRKTYLSGQLRGKYQGQVAGSKKGQYEHTAFYDFHIYEAEVFIKASAACSCVTICKQECNGLHTEAEGEFDGRNGIFYSCDKLPRQLPVTVVKDGEPYALHIYEPLLAHVRFPSGLHQTEDKEVFGTIEAEITGFLLDFIEAECTERVYFREAAQSENPVEVITRQLIRRIFPNVHW
jgi:hypothetical protein